MQATSDIIKYRLSTEYFNCTTKELQTIKPSNIYTNEENKVFDSCEQAHIYKDMETWLKWEQEEREYFDVYGYQIKAILILTDSRIAVLTDYC